MSIGWIKLNRKILEWEWYTDQNTTRLFIHLLLRATHKPTKWRGIDLNPGQLISGRKLLSSETGLSERAVLTALKRLKSTNEVIIKSNTKFSVFTINHWELYQTDDKGDQQSDQQVINSRSTTDQQPITFKNVKNDKNVNKNIKGLQKFESDFPYVKDEYFKTLILDHIKCNKKVGKSETAVKMRLKKLHEHTMEVAVNALENSIASGWQGIFPEKAKQQQGFKTAIEKQEEEWAKIEKSTASAREAMNKPQEIQILLPEETNYVLPTMPGDNHE